jgi:D-alanyl-lipoteichoic acid acyltransferase DltB (MBOAT superfamily)
LGGSKVGLWAKTRNTFVIFLVSGFWHGANWTFLVWGFLNALYIMPSIILGLNRRNLDIVAKGKLLPTFKELFEIGLTFSLTTFAWIFFRSENIEKAFIYISGIVSSSLFSIPEILSYENFSMLGIFILIEWVGREKHYAIANVGLKWPRILRWSFYYMILFSVFQFSGTDQSFIYFQF